MSKSFGWNGSAVGWAQESTYDTAVARDEWIRVKSESLKPMLDVAVRDTIFPVTSGAEMVQPTAGRYLGMQKPGGSFAIDAHYEGLDKLFTNIFGDSTESNPEGSAYQHIYPLIQAAASNPGLTFEVDKDDHTIIISGGMIVGIHVKVIPERSLEYTFDVRGSRVTHSGSGIAPTLNTYDPIEDWHLKLEIDDTEIDFDGFEFDLVPSYKWDPVHDATNKAWRLPIKDAFHAANGKIMRVYEGDTYYALYRALTSCDVKLTATGGLITGSTYKTHIWQMEDAIITDIPPVTDAPGPRLEQIMFDANSDGTNAGVKLTTINTDQAALW